MSDVFMALDASVLRSVRLGQYRRMCDPRRRTARLAQQIIMTMQTYPIRYMVQNLLSHSPGVVFRTKVMFIGILGPCISLRRNMCEVLVFRRKMAIDTFDTNALCVGAMRREFPAQVRGIHFVTLAAAILGCRYGYHGRISATKHSMAKITPARNVKILFLMTLNIRSFIQTTNLYACTLLT